MFFSSLEGREGGLFLALVAECRVLNTVFHVWLCVPVSDWRVAPCS